MTNPSSTIRRETRQEVFELGVSRPMMFEFRPEAGFVETWPKGTQRRVIVNLAAEWQRGMKRKADEKRREKRRNRKSSSRSQVCLGGSR